MEKFNTNCSLVLLLYCGGKSSYLIVSLADVSLLKYVSNKPAETRACFMSG